MKLTIYVADPETATDYGVTVEFTPVLPSVGYPSPPDLLALANAIFASDAVQNLGWTGTPTLESVDWSNPVFEGGHLYPTP